MNFTQMIKDAQTGDVLLVKGEGFISKLIRSGTGESFSHVAMLCRSDHVFVREFVEGKGYQDFDTVNLWMKKRKGQAIYYGEAPVMDRKQVLDSSVNFPFSDSYGYLSLVKVWFSQLFGAKIKTRRKVCSTYVQHCWESGGFKFEETADPGDYLNLCTSVSRLTS